MSNDLSDVRTGDLSDVKTRKKEVFELDLQPVANPLEMLKKRKRVKKGKDYTFGSGIVDPSIT